MKERQTTMLLDHRGQPIERAGGDEPLTIDGERVRGSQLSAAEKYAGGDVVEGYAFDNEDDSLIVTRLQNCAPFLERNHYIREHSGEAWRGDDNDFWKVASIPNIVIEDWLKRGIDVFRDEDWPKVRALLNGEYKYLKTTPKEI